MYEKYGEILTVKELCEMLQICRSSAYKLINEKKIPSFRVGRLLRFKKSAIIAYINSNQ